jgi:predicted nucleic acid-binding protein
MAGRFVDTNVLLYLASGDQRKADLAEAALSQGGTISVQVLNEIANVLRRKMQMSWSDTHVFIDMVRALLTVEPVTTTTHQNGLVVSERYGLSIYDAMIVAAALLSGCDTLLSEDMQDGLVIDGGLRIVNPFGLPPKSE